MPDNISGMVIRKDDAFFLYYFTGKLKREKSNCELVVKDEFGCQNNSNFL